MSLAELLVVFVVALIVLGPQHLAATAQTLAKITIKFRHLKTKLADDFENHVKLEQLKQNIARAEQAEKSNAE